MMNPILLLLLAAPSSGDDPFTLMAEPCLAWLERAAKERTFVYVAESGEQQISIFELDAETGELNRRGEVAVEGGPGVLCVAPGKTTLYSTAFNGSVVSFRIDPKTGALTRTGSGSTEGRKPTFVITDTKGTHLFMAYYRDGKVSVHSIGEGGVPSAKPLQWLDTAPNAHCIRVDAKNKFVFVPHTRPNRIYQFRFDAKAGRLVPNDPPFLQREENSGPRHYVHHPTLDRIYATDEQGNSMSGYLLDPKKGTLKHAQTVSSLPEGFKERNSTSHIEMHPTGKFVYIGNRGHDSIAVYRIALETGRFERVQLAPTESVPRGFAVSPTGRFLYSAGQRTNKLAAYRIDGVTGMLTRFTTYDIGKRAGWVYFVTTER